MDDQRFHAALSRRVVLKGASFAGLALSGGGLASAAGPASRDGFVPARWWEQDYRIVQTNLREIDVLEDPREIARAIKAFGGNVVVSNIGGIVAFYPTKLELQYRNPYLKGDFVAGMIEAAHAEGLAYVGRFDLSKAMKPAFDAHPDWFMMNRAGGPRVYEGTYQACPNGGWAKEYGLKILTEALTRYKPDGVFFNMTGYPQTDYANVAHGICVCTNCQTAFRAMYGRDLPRVEGFADPAWPDYLDFQERTATAVAKQADDLAHRLIPGTPITKFDAFDVVGRGEVQRRVSRPAPEWAYQSGEQCRVAMARNPGKPWSSTSAAHIDYPWRQVTETAACHQTRFAQMLGVGAKLDLYLMGSLAGQDDQTWLPPIARLYHWEAASTAIYQGLKPAARTGLYLSEATQRFGGATPWGGYVTGAWRGAYSALVDSRIPFQVVSGQRAGEGGIDLRATFDTIVVPHAILMPPVEAAALDRFVQAGGLLITSGATGACDARGQRVSANALASAPLASHGAPQKAEGWTLDPTKGDWHALSERVPIDALYFGGPAREGVSDLAPFAPDQRYGPPEYSYAIPGAAPRRDPGVMTMAYGQGRSVHIPWLYDWQYYRDGLPVHQRLLAGLIARYAPQPAVVLHGAGAVELTAQRAASGRMLLHVINYTGQRGGRYDDPPLLHDLKLGVAGSAAQARALMAGETLAGEAREGRVWFSLPPVGAFEAILV